MRYAIMTVKSGADDLIVSENDIATYFMATTEHTTEPNLGKISIDSYKTGHRKWKINRCLQNASCPS